MKWLLGAFLGIAGLYGLYCYNYPSLSYRFRITLNVDTPQGVKTGSGVMEVQHRRYPAWTTLGANTGQSSLLGDAIFVDLGPDVRGNPRSIVALLAMGPKGEDVDLYLLPGRVFEPLWKANASLGQFRGTSADVARLPIGTKAELPRHLVPTLLIFEHTNDPSTARAISRDDLQGQFGKDVRLLNATIEIVSAGTWPLRVIGVGGVPITRGIENKLSWSAGSDRPSLAALKAAGLVTPSRIDAESAFSR